MKILVTDANNRVALAVIQALGRTGADITVTDCSGPATAGWRTAFTTHNKATPLCFASRYARRKIILPPLNDESNFISALLAAAQGHNILLPVSINSILTVAKHRTRFEQAGIIIPVPPLELINRVNNKKSLMDIAKAAGIPTPITYQPDKCPDESFLQRVSGTLRLPVVVKLAEDSGLYLPPARRYHIVNQPDELANAWTGLHRLKPFPLIQEYIPGEGYGFSALIDNQSNVRAFFCHKRLREYPLNGGPSVLCQSIYDPALVESGTRLLKAVGWQGVAMVEFRKDKRDNTYKLMEINPRFWGSLPLATYSGVNFPDLLCRWASGKAFQPVLNYRIPAKVRFAFLDLLILQERLKRGQISSLYNFIADSFDADIKEGLWDWSDPRPFFRYIWKNS